MLAFSRQKAATFGPTIVGQFAIEIFAALARLYLSTERMINARLSALDLTNFELLACRQSVLVGRTWTETEAETGELRLAS